jgi:hypothetical protein
MESRGDKDRALLESACEDIARAAQKFTERTRSQLMAWMIGAENTKLNMIKAHGIQSIINAIKQQISQGGDIDLCKLIVKHLVIVTNAMLEEQHDTKGEFSKSINKIRDNKIYQELFKPDSSDQVHVALNEQIKNVLSDENNHHQKNLFFNFEFADRLDRHAWHQQNPP